jgi:MFS family permease
MAMTNEKNWHLNRVLLVLSKIASSTIALTIPSITIFWEEKGISKSDSYLLQIFFALALITLEIATGRFADTYGKALTIRLAFLFQILGAYSYMTATSFSDFLVGEVFYALGISLCSGTDEAFLFQSCKAIKKENEHSWWWSTISSYGFWTMAVCVSFGGWLASISLTLPYVIALGFQVLALLMTFFMTEPPLANDASESTSQITAIRNATKVLLFNGSEMRWLVFIPCLAFAINQPFLWIYPDIMLKCGLKLEHIGLAFALLNIVSAVSASRTRRITKTQAEIVACLGLFLALGISTLGLLFAIGFWAWLFILPQQIVRSSSGILFSTTMNKATPDEIRATTLSVRNAIRSLAYVIAMLPWWLFVDKYGINFMLLMNTILIIALFILAWWFKPKTA